MNWEDENRQWLKRERDLIRRAEELRAEMASNYGIAPADGIRPVERRTPSPTQSYESLDHFLFQPDIHWNGQTVDRD